MSFECFDNLVPENCVALEWVPSGDKVEERDAGRPDVHLEAGERLLAVGDLGRLEGRRPLTGAARVVEGELVQNLGHAEVSDLQDRVRKAKTIQSDRLFCP